MTTMPPPDDGEIGHNSFDDGIPLDDEIIPLVNLMNKLGMHTWASCFDHGRLHTDNYGCQYTCSWVKFWIEKDRVSSLERFPQYKYGVYGCEGIYIGIDLSLCPNELTHSGHYKGVVDISCHCRGKRLETRIRNQRKAILEACKLIKKYYAMPSHPLLLPSGKYRNYHPERLNCKRSKIKGETKVDKARLEEEGLL